MSVPGFRMPQDPPDPRTTVYNETVLRSNSSTLLFRRGRKYIQIDEPFQRGEGIIRIVTANTEAEHDLVCRAQTGDSAAFQRLAERQAEALFSCAITLCRDRHWAEDLVQETLIEAWRSLGRFDRRCRFSTWLYGILRHRFLKGIRRRGRTAPAWPEALSDEALVQIEPTPRSAAERSEDALRVRNAVAGLPDEHRAVVELRFFAGASLDEIAATVGCPLGTVKSRLHHGLEKLRQMNLAVNLFPSERESPVRKP
jgi:RNA polymerase sigma-70 factor (ECF subfamily)